MIRFESASSSRSRCAAVAFGARLLLMDGMITDEFAVLAWR
jgi:hypothetical protein